MIMKEQSIDFAFAKWFDKLEVTRRREAMKWREFWQRQSNL